MNWLAWRQLRKQFMVAGIIIAIFAAITIPTGLNFWHTYQRALSTCASTATCNQLSNELFLSSIDNTMFHLIPSTILFMPIILGLFLGVPLLSKEYGEGTNKLVWTQGVSRRKWLIVKFVWIVIGAAIISAILSFLDTWWSRTGNALNLDRFNDLQFSTQGIVPVAYTIFAVTLGISIGAWLKRTMAALGATLLVLIILLLIVVPSFARPYFAAPVTVTASMSPAAIASKIPNNGVLMISQNIVSKSGQTFNSFSPGTMPEQCKALIKQIGPNAVGGPTVIGTKTRQAGDTENIIYNCLDSAGYYQIAKYQPSYRYWDFQRIESGLYLALSIIPIGATYWLVLKRDA